MNLIDVSSGQIGWKKHPFFIQQMYAISKTKYAATVTLWENK
jgi:hypothetical protein